MNLIRNLEPKNLWHYFSDLNEIPRASKKEEKVIDFIKNFGKSLNLNTIIDETGNVLIKKPASKGFENRKKVILQSHLDMVWQKNNDIDFDFKKQGIKMLISKDGNWIHADGTTLGADNGIGVAAIMSILASKEINHPELEALFTVDEETGMSGALGLKKGFLSGDILLNLDTEDDNEIYIGCAGGIDVTAESRYEEIKLSDEFITYEISISGLRGGHSGVEIHFGYGNSNKILSRFLYSFNELNNNNNFYLNSIEGGGLRNAIPREANAVFSIKKDFKPEIEKIFNSLKYDIINEFFSLEKNLKIDLNKVDNTEVAVSNNFSSKFIPALFSAYNGVFRMSPDIENLVETSNNIANVEVKKGKAFIACLTRSSIESSKIQLANSLKVIFEFAEMNITFSSAYPGWRPNPDSEIVKLMENIYERLNNEKANVVSCHAGLECGIIGENYPNMEMVSFGPTIQFAHSPRERVNIASVNKFWKFFLEILENIPKKK